MDRPQFFGYNHEMVGHRNGSVAEWTNAPHLKCGKPVMVSEVRILSLPPSFKIRFSAVVDAVDT